jgi:hypothetical protein
MGFWDQTVSNYRRGSVVRTIQFLGWKVICSTVAHFPQRSVKLCSTIPTANYIYRTDVCLLQKF